MALSHEERQRYRRHLAMPEVGLAGQEAIGQAKVLVLGTGGLGAPAAIYLAAAGVGTLGLVDHDRVELSNLQRQILFRERDIGRVKLAAAWEMLRGINSRVEINLHAGWLTHENALEIVAGYDLVLNGCDNFPTRYLINDACVLLGKPLIDGCIYQFEGQVTVYHAAGGSPCYRCRFPEPPPPGVVPSCAEGGVLGVLPGLVGTLQAAEALKWILRGAGVADAEPLLGRLLMIDLLAAEFQTFEYPRRPDCPICGDTPTITRLIDYDAFCRGESHAEGVAAGTDSVPTAPGGEVPLELTVEELRERQAAGEAVALLDVRAQWEWDLCHLAGAQHIPLSELSKRARELPTDRPLVVYCHAGIRSMAAIRTLRSNGWPAAQSLAGGIDAWSTRIDPRVPRY